jgi:pilus assembly protein CpaB
MSKNNLILLISLLLAAFVAWIGNTWIDQRYGGQEKSPELVKIVVAAKDIPIDTKIDQTHLKLVGMPPASLPAGYLTSADQILGKRLKETVYSGEVILGRRLLEDSDASMLSATLTPGKRAVAVRVDDIIGVSGFILPGSHVDVISSGGGQGAHTLLQDIKVLTVGQTLAAEGGTLKAASVTLEVDPRQAEILMQATEQGSIRLGPAASTGPRPSGSARGRGGHLRTGDQPG